MKIHTAIVGFADIGRLLTAVEHCGVTPPEQLTDVLQAHQKLTAAVSIASPTKQLVAAALDGRTSPEKVDKLLEQTAIARLVAEERKSLQQRIEPELLEEFGRRLDDGGADSVLDLLRPQFDQAATTLRKALQTVGVVPDDPSVFLESASSEELGAWQSVRPAVAELEKIAAIARVFGPGGAFPTVPDPRTIDPVIRCGWLHDVATMCTDSDLLASCAEFQKPSPLSDVRRSPWLKVSPHLHSVDSARERLRAWCEASWQAEEAGHPVGGRLIDGEVVYDQPRRNPFALAVS